MIFSRLLSSDWALIYSLYIIVYLAAEFWQEHGTYTEEWSAMESGYSV